MARLKDVPINREDARKMLGAEPVGFRAITKEGPACLGGCLALGSSPHSHSTVTEWQVFGPLAGVRLSPDGHLLGSFAIHAFES